jgi:putative RNA 2'-phosphotransferase
MNKQLVEISKFLSFVLRHKPQAIGITLDAEGWVAVDELLAAAVRHGQSITRQQLEEVVATNDKQRFSFSADGRLIRANQGHSIEVDLGLVPVEPPELLYHGTVARFLDSIREKGLVRGKRHHVHLSADRDTAARVGQRRGRPVVLVIEARCMRGDGHAFFQSENGVWLTEAVPPAYLQFPKGTMKWPHRTQTRRCSPITRIEWQEHDSPLRGFPWVMPWVSVSFTNPMSNRSSQGTRCQGHRGGTPTTR